MSYFCTATLLLTLLCTLFEQNGANKTKSYEHCFDTKSFEQILCTYIFW
jgi:hypothetical protein